MITLTIGFAFTWIWPVAWVILIGLFIVGLGISVQFPLGMARIMRASAHYAFLIVPALIAASVIALRMRPVPAAVEPKVTNG